MEGSWKLVPLNHGRLIEGIWKLIWKDQGRRLEGKLSYQCKEAEAKN